jgi:error-prone DNA polymerase
VEQILERTLGVPLFQEQAMKLAMVAAGFSAGEADALRRILTHKRALALLGPYQERFTKGCVERGYPVEFALSCFQQFKGFAHYGFPESHSASFALIAYASSYLKCYYPAALTAAVINSQPMGFYAPHTLLDDARRHGVEVRPLDVAHSSWDCTFEPGKSGLAIRLGLRLVRGLREETARKLVAARGDGYASLGDLARRSRIPRYELTRLALAGALGSFGGSRREALWEIQALGPLDGEDLFFGLPMDDTRVELPPMSAAERVSSDYATVGLSLEQHPVELMRPQLRKRGAVSAAQLAKVPDGRRAGVGGMVLVRQKPPTAKGFCFLSLEDESGIANLVVEPRLFERYRREITREIFLYAQGRVERSGQVVNLKVTELSALGLEEAESPATPAKRPGPRQGRLDLKF